MIEKIKKHIKACKSKEELNLIIEKCQSRISSLGVNVGDDVELCIDYMIGDADGDTSETYSYYNITSDELDAVNVVTHILSNHTEPNKGTWGFILNRDSFSKKPDEVYNILYNQEEAPTEYNGIVLSPEVLEEIDCIRSEAFRGETDYSFLVYQGYSING